ncbi:MAG: phospholipid carrier-dependent glycosyltransferase [Candidatus Woesebacteria bacterium]|nr:MAG: phospholipid carrier-dependent glycosyltransferase [Candidatus Woesebacteria bacterium]
MKLKNIPVPLIIIIFFGAILRFTMLSQMPPSLNWDEVSHGYNAYSILKTGHDEWGKFFPITNFRAYGDYPLPLNLYLTIPFIKTLGLNEFAIRAPHALLGVGTIIATYFLAYGVTKNKKISLIASFLASIDPWLLFPSRAVFQSNLSVFFLTSALAAFVNREKNKFLLPLASLFLGLTLFSYHSTRILSPLLLISLLFIYREEFLKHLKKITPNFLLSIVFLIVFFAPLPFIFLNPDARARSNVVFLLDQGAVNQIENLRNNSGQSYKNLIYNKFTYFTVKFLQNYIDYFSPQFLFLNGGTQYQFSVPNQGLLYLINLPFFYFGLFLCLKNIKKKEYQLLLIWLILAPIPAAITQDKFAVIRATTMLPLPEILVGIGIIKILEKLKNNREMAILMFVIAMILSLENYIDVYAKSYRQNYSWSWQYGYKQIVGYIQENYENYDKIIITKKYGEPHEYFLFFLQYNPAKFINDKNLIRYGKSNWFWVDRFDKFYFVNDWQIPHNNSNFILESKKEEINCDKNIKCLLISSPENHPVGWKLLKIINFLDNSKAFEIWKN